MLDHKTMPSRRPASSQNAAPPQPDRSRLREAALAHLARFSTTEQALSQVLERRILRWARQAADAGLDAGEVASAAAALRPLAGQIAAEMTTLGAVDDAAFAKARAARLTRSGRSRRVVQARLAAKGLDASVIDDALEGALGEGDAGRDAELGAALVFARKRRVGPFRPEGVEGGDNEDVSRILAAFARAGFSRDVAERVLATERDEADERIHALRNSP